MKFWGQDKEIEAGMTGGDEFDRAAARVSAEVPEGPGPGAVAAEPETGESLMIRPEWAEAAARLCFLPAARMVHPAYALADEEAAAISPQMQKFLQAVADKYAPAALGRVANKYPEFFDLAAALGVLYWQKWRYVSHLRQMEVAQRAEKQAQDNPGEEAAGPTLVKPGEQFEKGMRVI